MTEALRPTDWDAYYQAPAPPARLTRRYTQARLLAAIGRHLRPRYGAVFAELGGANSCFHAAMVRRFRPRHYHVLDNNRLGLELFRHRCANRHDASAHEVDLAGSSLPAIQADLVFSVGLIEHFDVVGTRRVLAAHRALVRPGGLLLVTFPTPTWLYRAVRGAAERAGRWAFSDERPLLASEVRATLDGWGQRLEAATIWPIVLTQGLLLYRLNQACDGASSVLAPAVAADGTAPPMDRAGSPNRVAARLLGGGVMGLR
jgi:SAM-dependent methyltransferase